MSEIESVEARRAARRASGKTMARSVRIAAVVAALCALLGAIFGAHTLSLIVACIAFIAYLVADDLSRR